MLVLTVNPEKKTTKIVSIPRDTRTKLINNKNPKKNRSIKLTMPMHLAGLR